MVAHAGPVTRREQGIARVRDLWGGKLILKGIMEVEDARLAAQSGADALVVSNHGGRQLDGVLSSARALPGARGSDADFYRGKLHAARFFATHELPRVRAHAELLASADRTTTDMQEAWF